MKYVQLTYNQFLYEFIPEPVKFHGVNIVTDYNCMSFSKNVSF